MFEAIDAVDLDNCIIYVNGFEKSKYYILKDNDLCTVRQFPRGGNVVTAVVDTLSWIADPVGSLISTSITGHTLPGVISEKIEDEYEKMTQEQIKNALSSANVSDTTVSVESIPSVNGCKNQTLLNKVYPFILGRTYYAPYVLGKPYTTISKDDLGKYQTFHCLYMIGYNHVNVTDISLGLYKLASNKDKVRNGFIDIDGFYDKDKYQIKLEIQDSDEVSIYNQKVVQSNCNIELICEKTEVGSSFVYNSLKAERFSARYPQKVELEVLVNGLGTTDGGSNTEAIIAEYSIDGGNTYKRFRLFDENERYWRYGNYSQGGTVFENANIISGTLATQARFASTVSFDYDEIKDAVNHVIEFRIYRVSPSNGSNNLNQGIVLSAIRTWCYNPKKSKVLNDFVPQEPLVENDRKKTTRLGFEIKILEDVVDLGELNCIAQSLGRTFANGEWSGKNELSETCNPASLGLLSLQSPMRGLEQYEDYELDMDDYGRFYDWCKNYDIKNAKGEQVGFECNGVVIKNYKTSELLGKILACGRGSMRTNGNKYGVLIDKPIENTVMILNNQNVLEANNSKAFDEEINGVRVIFTNEDNYYQQDELVVCNDGYTETDENLKTAKLNLDFQTNVEQIYKNGRYELAKLLLRTEIWQRKVTSEGSVAEIGSLIEIQDDTICVGIGNGAEVKGLVFDDDKNPTSIIGVDTDGDFEVTDLDQTYGVKIQTYDNIDSPAIITRKVVIDHVGFHNRLIFEEPIDLEESIKPYVDDIVSFGVFDRITIDCICIGKQDNGDETFVLDLVPYIEGVYYADSAPMPEFDSKVTPPQRVIPQTGVTISQLMESVSRSEPTEPTGKPTAVSGFIYQDNISLVAVYEGTGLSNNVDHYTFEITKADGSKTYVSSKTSNASYVFDRNVDGFPTVDLLDQWTVRAKITNSYGNDSDYSDSVSLDYGISKDKYIWIPAKPVCTVLPVADEKGIKIDWSLSGENIGTDLYKVEVFNGDEKIFTSEELNEKSYLYVFNREINGYPEASDLDEYKIIIKHYNEAYSESTAVLSDVIRVDTDSYGTWLIPQMTTDNVITDTIDRTVMLRFTTSEPSRKQYGTSRYKVSIKRIGISKADENGDYPEVLPDDNWYKPNLLSNPMSDENGYRTDDVDGYVISNGSFQQTLPLVGQSIDKPSICNTVYQYKVVPFNESEKEIEPFEFTVIALCTSLRDIVKANADYKNLYVERLSAINANIGLITQGGFGDFGNLKNYWALSTLAQADTGLAEKIYEGSFRVGNENQYIKVDPVVVDERVVDYRVSIKAGNISFTASGIANADFVGGTFINDENNSRFRLSLSSNGMEIQEDVSENNDWSSIRSCGKVFVDSHNNMVITNATEEDEGYPVTGNECNGSDVVYHLEGDTKDADGGNAENLQFNGTFVGSNLINEQSLQFNGTIKKNESKVQDMLFFNNSNLIQISGKYIDIDNMANIISAEDWNEKLNTNVFVNKE